MIVDGQATFDTNIAVYALSEDPKGPKAAEIVEACAFVSVQVLNEYANVAARKLERDWRTISEDLVRLCSGGPKILPIDAASHGEALRIAGRYRLSFYDALMLAVALLGGARTFYSEDMQHDLVIDGTLRVVDPFRPGASEA